MMVRPMEVTMKMIADHVVSLVRRLAAPRGPKAVCEPWPPKAPARSADLPCWRRTTPTRKRQTMTCRMTRRVTIGAALEPLCRKTTRRMCGLVRRRGLEPLCLAAQAPQACASANFATSALCLDAWWGASCGEQSGDQYTIPCGLAGLGWLRFGIRGRRILSR